MPLADRGSLPASTDSHPCRACGRRGPSACDHRCSLVEPRSPAMQLVSRRARAIAQTNAPVVLLGETGTGKEVLARALHHGSPRADRPFVPINCGAIPGELLESELFGHVRGAFSGAVADKPGLFESAAGGTLLLDEVADLPSSLQVKLLRVLQDGEVRRVGSNRAVAPDVRVIAATHKDLEALVARGLFRADLYYRIKVLSIRLPALRERAEDILPLARLFLAMEREPPRQLSPAAEPLLLQYRWPGNIRELSNAMRCASALADGPLIEPHHLPEEIARTADPSAVPGRFPTLAEVEREHVLAALRACHGVQSLAAKALGIARNTLWRKLQTYGSATSGELELADEALAAPEGERWAASGLPAMDGRGSAGELGEGPLPVGIRP
jgi:DNA-binding NtrC family response regulator